MDLLAGELTEPEPARSRNLFARRQRRRLASTATWRCRQRGRGVDQQGLVEQHGEATATPSPSSSAPRAPS
jgi:hypothetical protein